MATENLEPSAPLRDSVEAMDVNDAYRILEEIVRAF